MDVAIKILQVLAALSILVLVHELGHFFFARLFKIRVEKFYMFFNLGFSLFKYKPKNSDTEYGIGWLPLGGYCKIAGMIDESMDKEALKEEPKPWEFRSKPAWQRFLVMFGGVFFNFILAILIYSATLFTWGEEYLKNEDAAYGIECNDLAQEIGFKHGDRIVSFNGEKIDKFNELQMVMARNQASISEVIRDGELIEVDIDPIFLPAVLNTPNMFTLRVPFQILSVPDSSLNLAAGLITGDRIIAIDSTEASTIQDIQRILQSKRGEAVTATILRDGRHFNTNLTIDDNGLLGLVLNTDIRTLFNVTTYHYSVVSAIPMGTKKAVTTITNYLKELKLIFSPKTQAYKSVGSFIAIGSIFPSTWVWQIFWNLTAWLSVMLAVLNLLPIPALDGGHILFLVYEMVTGRKPADKVMEYAQVAGMLILFAIMFLAFGNDIYKLFN